MRFLYPLVRGSFFTVQMISSASFLSFMFIGLYALILVIFEFTNLSYPPIYFLHPFVLIALAFFSYHGVISLARDIANKHYQPNNAPFKEDSIALVNSIREHKQFTLEVNKIKHSLVNLARGIAILMMAVYCAVFIHLWIALFIGLLALPWLVRAVLLFNRRFDAKTRRIYFPQSIEFHCFVTENFLKYGLNQDAKAKALLSLAAIDKNNADQPMIERLNSFYQDSCSAAENEFLGSLVWSTINPAVFPDPSAQINYKQNNEVIGSRHV